MRGVSSTGQVLTRILHAAPGWPDRPCAGTWARVRSLLRQGQCAVRPRSAEPARPVKTEQAAARTQVQIGLIAFQQRLALSAVQI